MHVVVNFLQRVGGRNKPEKFIKIENKYQYNRGGGAEGL
jgi:hypothetical protein